MVININSLRNLTGGTRGRGGAPMPITQPTDDNANNWTLLPESSTGQRANREGQGEDGHDGYEDGGGGAGEGFLLEDSVASSRERTGDGGSGGGGGGGGSGLGGESNGGGSGGSQGRGGGAGFNNGGGHGTTGGNEVIGFAAVLQADGWNFREEAVVETELQWQKHVNGEAARITAFTERVLGLQDFKAFCFMKAGSPWVQVGHGLGKFYSVYGTVPELDGKVLMFVGDRGKTRDLMPVQPPVQNTWKWITVNVATDEADLFAFFQANAGGNGLWQAGGGNHTMGDRKVPYILALPGVLLAYIYAQGGQCRPHELLREIRRLQGEYTLAADQWDLVATWCVVAAQAAAADGDSHLALKILPAFSADTSFLEWCERRVDITMGLRVREIGGSTGISPGSSPRV